ncbi:phosphate ABC transporter permease subunit PstC [Alphaproteobacteria bacterium]|nr:phosphate ABC transporter permease subunit PstC [Alphaproteobacteria bacterium]
MTTTSLLVLLAAMALLSYAYSLKKIRQLAIRSPEKLHSLPRFHGAYTAAWVFGIPALLTVIWIFTAPIILNMQLIEQLGRVGLEPGEVDLLVSQVISVANGSLSPDFVSKDVLDLAVKYEDSYDISSLLITIIAIIAAFISFAFAIRRLAVRFTARHSVERLARAIMVLASVVAVLTTLGIVMSLVFETIQFFRTVPVLDFLTGTQWSPQIALRADQIGSSGAFGAIPLFTGTLLITFLAMIVSVPIGLFAAIFLSEYASPRVRSIAKPALEILAGVPTVVYGFFAAIVVAPFLRDTGASVGLVLSSESALAAGIVMGVMIIPFISSLSDDVMNAVPQSLRDGALALGATKSETIKQVILPAAFPGIVSAVLLAVSRAIGETMIVVMAAGVAANLTANPFESVTTITVQIVMLLVGDQEFDSPKTLAAFALGMLLFLVTLGLNVIALYVSRRYREKYD